MHSNEGLTWPMIPGYRLPSIKAAGTASVISIVKKQKGMDSRTLASA